MARAMPGSAQDRIIRIGGASGFWGESSLATGQLLGDGSLDYLVYDYLAEITMSLMARARAADLSAHNCDRRPHGCARNTPRCRARWCPRVWRACMYVAVGLLHGGRHGERVHARCPAPATIRCGVSRALPGVLPEHQGGLAAGR